MNNISKVILLLFISTGIKAQTDTTYYSEHHKNLGHSYIKDAEYYELNSGEKKEGKIEGFYINGNSYGHAHYDDNQRHGRYINLYESGKIKESGIYDKGQPVGLRKRRHPNGLMRSVELIEEPISLYEPKIINAWDATGNLLVSKGAGEYSNPSFDRPEIIEIGQYQNGVRTGNWTASKSGNNIYKETYDQEGKVISGTSYDSSSKPYDYTQIDEDFSFPGGATNFKKFQTDNLKYPEIARKHNIEGVVWINFIIDERGKTKDLKVFKSLSKECDEEVIRIIHLSSMKWIPSKHRGQNIQQKVILSVFFNLK